MSQEKITGDKLFTHYLDAKDITIKACLKQNLKVWLQIANPDELLEVYKTHGEKFLVFVAALCITQKKKAPSSNAGVFSFHHIQIWDVSIRI